MSVTFEKLKESIKEQIDDPINPNGKFIYFMDSPDNDLIKIGISNNPYNRCKSVSSKVPFNVDVLAFFPDNGTFERSLHEHFKKFQYTKFGREWFVKNRNLDDLIKVIKLNKDKLPELNKDVQLSMRLPLSLKLRLKIMAVRKGVTLNDLVTKYINEGLAKEKLE